MEQSWQPTGDLEEETFNEEFQPTLDSLKCQQTQQRIDLAREAFGYSKLAIITILILIIGFILLIASEILFSSIPKLIVLSKIWHLYLISIFSLTTTLVVLIAFNRSTWQDAKRIQEKDDLLPQAKGIMEIFEAVKKINKD